jgi:23S rRNA G2445 N2-methylase RlmL
VRVLEEVGRFACPDGDALYEGVREAYRWDAVLDVQRTLAVTAAVKSGQLTHSAFVAQRTKDAIVDQLRERFGAPDDREPFLTRRFKLRVAGLDGHLHRSWQRVREGQSARV